MTPHPDDLARLFNAKRLMGTQNFSTLLLWKAMRDTSAPFASDNTTNRWLHRMVKLGHVRKVVRGLYAFVQP